VRVVGYLCPLAQAQNIFYIKQYTYIVEHTQQNVNAKKLQQLLILKA
jgi:hypothetical protein